ncbi:MAG: sugar transferase [Rhodoluna sp.]|nr:sugar transferase [Rhodoluna sp.]
MKQIKPTSMRAYAAAVGLLDFIVLTVTTLITYVLTYQTFRLLDPIEASGTLRIEIDPQAVGLTMLGTWLIALAVFKTRDTKVIGSDFLEYRRIVNASLTVLGLLAFNSLFFKVDVSRVFVTSLIVFGLLALLLERRIARAWLKRQRLQGRFKKRIVVYGPEELTVESVERLSNNKDHEFEPVFTISGTKQLKLKMIATGEEKEFELQDLPEICKAHNVELLKVVGSSATSADMHKRLYWALDGHDISFVVSPAITGVSSSKLTTRVIAGTPLLEISSTKFSGPQYAIKTVFDFVFSLVALILVSPIMLVTAIAIRLHDGGPVFFKQTRVGVRGQDFQILKFRSMKVGAEKEFEQLAEQVGYEINAVQFKLKDDPRVTSIGKFIRKTSIDELPQFINVLKGDMSVVGPRPHVHKEVEAYDDHAVRRLLVKPGITGPWQVGGRSELTWEESVSLDLNYVEQWGLLVDISIILKTAIVVFARSGSY